MKKQMLKLALLSILLSVQTLWAKPPVVPESAPLDIQVPAFDVKTLSCGLKVIFLKSPEMPLVSAKLIIPGGNVADPLGQEGLAALMGSNMRDGGAGDRSPEEFDAALENKAASLSASSDTETFTAEFKCLAPDLQDILPLFADMVLRPQFNVKRFETSKSNMLDEVRRVEDTPDALTRVLFNRALMGHSAYGQWANPTSVASITRQDVVAFFKAHYGPTGAVLAVTGQFDEAQVLQKLEDLFGGWTAQEKPAAPAEAKPLGPTIYFFPKKVGQVFIRYGVLGIKRHDPQDYALSVANYILGGSGFTSRLMHQIRSDRGLAYFVDSVIVPYNIPGVYEVIGGTRPDSVKEYLSVMFQVLGDFAKDGPTEAELKQAQRSIVEEFAYNFESPFDIAGYNASLVFNHYPENYLQTYRDKIKALTQKDVAQAAQRILSQKDWVLVVAGPEELEPQLESFGEVHKVSDIYEALTENP